jgi:hypothetical protein
MNELQKEALKRADECRELQLEIAELLQKQPDHLLRKNIVGHMRMGRLYIMGAADTEEILKRTNELMEEMKTLKEMLVEKLQTLN